MPTYGLVSRAGVMPNSFTFDHCGPMARTVEDCAILLQVLAGFDPADAGSTEQEIPDYRAALGGDLKGLRVGVLRHYWEEDAPAHADHKKALEAALATFGKLGAKMEDCRTRPIRELLDIKVVIAETELLSIHQDELAKRPGDFGRDFLGRVLPACVFQSVDYVQALREHRRYLDEMKPLYEKYDVLLTSGLGPAPRLDASRTVAFWRGGNVCTPANVGRNPALMVPCGLSGTGLPMGLQIVGRPFGDATVLRVGHAYQTATDWHERRPALVPGAVQPAVNTDANEPAKPDLDAATRGLVEKLAQRVGLKLDERQMAMLLESAPYALAMAARVRKPRDRMEEPSMVFRFVDR
jgi:aspartyl-tRNA(Asn)/glutamyl-tRNA(Gln) amidotransferase subunit A